MWFKWLLVGLFLLGPVMHAQSIGKESKPTTAEGTAIHMALALAIVAGILWYWPS